MEKLKLKELGYTSGGGTGVTYGGGIAYRVGYGSGDNKIINCYNLEECEDGLVSHFGGASYTAVISLTINNSYNLGKSNNSGLLGELGTVCKQRTLNINNCYNVGKSNKALVGSILESDRIESTTINIKNTYYDPSKSNSVGATQDGISPQNIKNNSSFVDTLNKNIGTNADWKQWKMGEDGYPTFK